MPVFLSRYINSQAGRDYFIHTSNTTSGLNTISTNIVRDLQVLCPPIELQQRFALIAQRHEQLRGQQREALRQAEQLFGGLLGQAFYIADTPPQACRGEAAPEAVYRNASL